MSHRASIYAALPECTAEVQRVLRICLGGGQPPAALTFPGGDMAAWSAEVFLPVIAPHTLRAWELALKGDGDGVAAADQALALPQASSEAGRALLARRDGRRQLPAARRFTAAVAASEARGHFATVVALQAAEFSIALLPMLQCLLYCEWRSAQPEAGRTGFEEFFRDARNVLSFLPSLIIPHVHDPAISAPRVFQPAGIHRRRSR
jgi:hypothetical protein